MLDKEALNFQMQPDTNFSPVEEDDKWQKAAWSGL